ncbi:MAG: CRISPR-associated endonuclease Cas2 [Candidatus Nezhaarchaeota archaeon]|nr:CRISPR-associated endonuclease Cas2 [Candidatus Nezhaarchaeota archaeon]MCX8142559.1 CRISPR-associated endonuclease Cas2 [Candidatus Nezhaarchaeota archaeon]
MYVVVAYDVQRDDVRERVRRVLWRYGLCPISKSVYAGRLTWSRATILCEELSRVVGEGDSIVAIPVQDSDFYRCLAATRGKIWYRSRAADVLVIGTDT